MVFGLLMSRELTENNGASSDSRARSLANLKPFKPGQSGNPGGRPKGIVQRAVRKQLLAEIASGVKNVDAVAAAQVEKAIAGDTAAFVAIRDTCDGKPGPADSDTSIGGITITVQCIGAVDLKIEK